MILKLKFNDLGDLNYNYGFFYIKLINLCIFLICFFSGLQNQILGFLKLIFILDFIYNYFFLII